MKRLISAAILCLLLVSCGSDEKKPAIVFSQLLYESCLEAKSHSSQLKLKQKIQQCACLADVNQEFGLDFDAAKRLTSNYLTIEQVQKRSNYSHRGSVAEFVGSKLRTLGRDRQVQSPKFDWDKLTFQFGLEMGMKLPMPNPNVSRYMASYLGCGTRE